MGTAYWTGTFFALSAMATPSIRESNWPRWRIRRIGRFGTGIKRRRSFQRKTVSHLRKSTPARDQHEGRKHQRMETAIDRFGLDPCECVGPAGGGFARRRKRNTARVGNVEQNNRRSVGRVRRV